MYCIVPLAGPDFYTEKFGIRPLIEYKGVPLIEYALKSRRWFGRELSIENIIFVLRHTIGTETAQKTLNSIFPSSQQVLLSGTTRGALMSALAAVPLIANQSAPVIIDLADIVYSLDEELNNYMARSPNWAGLIPYFNSTNPNYSYLKLKNENVSLAREKEVISNCASAGTYFFRDTPTFLRAILHATARPQNFLTNNNFFVCPVYNALITAGEKVLGIPTSNVDEVSLAFK